MKHLYTFTTLVFALFLFTLSAYSQKSKDNKKLISQFVEGELTIKLIEGIGDYTLQSGMIHFGIPSLDEKVQEFEIYRLEKRFQFNSRLASPSLPDLSRIYKLSYTSEHSLREIVNAFASDPNVEYAEGIPIHRVSVVPNDSLYNDCQHLPQVQAEEAWDLHKGEDGTEEIVIAIVDTGTNWEHEDLVDNVWQNLAEDADGDSVTIEFIDGEWVLDPGDLDGIDDDLNGYVDDLVGWNFINENGDPNPIPTNPAFNHGTHCAGIACGRTNNEIGVSSISYNLNYMAVCADDNNSLTYGYDGIIYAAENGADVISNSWGGGNNSIANQEVIYYATGLGSIVIGAAHNFNSEMAIYPASYLGVISVASVNEEDEKADYSNYHCSVDISAPGGEGNTGILSTLSDNTYDAWNGTSMATPLVAGALGLLKSYHPSWSNQELIVQILATTDSIEDLNPGYENMLGHGRINAYEMLLGENTEDPYLKLGVEQIYTEDDNDNGILESGELVSLSFDIRNYMQIYGADDVTITLSTSDPTITIISGETTVNIAPDTIVQLADLFEIQIADNVESHYAAFNLHFESAMEIKKGEDIPFNLLIAPSGYYVYEGDAEGEDYSGEYIYNYLIDNGFSVMYGSGLDFPTSLNGFEGVFLSFGNFSSGNTAFDDHYTSVVSDYIAEYEGDVYIEGGDVFGWDQLGNSALHSLFGLVSSSDGGTNPIDSLVGLENSLANALVYTSNTQSSNSWIDTYNPTAEADVAFEEINYGDVAVQYDAGNYQTFTFAYAISKLADGEFPSTRDNLLAEILYFFDMSTAIEEERNRDPFSITSFPNPTESGTTIRYYLPSDANITIEILNSRGQIVTQQLDKFYAQGQHEYYWNAEEMPAGVYYYTLRSDKHKSTGKIIKLK